jgi:predicted nucleotide-binding protein
MKRLLNAYRKLPSPSNRLKLQQYLDKHMMAICLATPEDQAFLKAHQFNI